MLALLSLALTFAHQPAISRAALDDAGKAAPAEAQAPALPTLENVRVVRICRFDQVASTAGGVPQACDTSAMTEHDSVRAGMGAIVVLQVRDLLALIHRSKCLADDGRQVPSCVPREIQLYLAGRAIPQLRPESGAPRPGDHFGTVQFHLERSAASDEAWADLLGGPRLESLLLRPMDVSIGLEGEFPLPTDVTAARFAFQRLGPFRLLIGSVLFLLAGIGLVWYARTSDGLRDLGPRPPGGELKPYSLGRCQMAWWFFLVVGAFGFIYLITNSWETVTDATLALLGISAGTFLGSAAIDAGALGVASKERASLHVRQKELQAEGKGLAAEAEPATAPADAQLRIRERRVENAREQASVQERLTAVAAAAAPAVSKGFLHDILGDDQGQSFHRLQMAIWTVVLSVLFIVEVWHRLAMPTFNATLLGLLGISNGTYLGFKFPERSN